VLQGYIDTKMPRPSTVDPIYEDAIKYLRDEVGIKRLGGVGYCFGGKYVCRYVLSHPISSHLCDNRDFKREVVY
jgi:dienelactone hydrolase